MSELGEYLRARRERLQPTEVGLPDSGRRRTPGLRREEVATLAGVSVDYLVRLEQGRDTNPSMAVLRALGTALRLNDEEQRHMAKLVAKSQHGGFCPEAGDPTGAVPDTVLALLRRLEPAPAYVAGPFGHVVAHTDAWAHLVAPLGLMDDDTPNMPRWVLTDLRARAAVVEWERAADEQVAQLRLAESFWHGDEQLDALIADLATTDEFALRWSAHDVEEQRRGQLRLVHPTLGELALAYEVLLLPDHDQQRLVTWLPLDDATATALDADAGLAMPTSPARLRVVGEG